MLNTNQARKSLHDVTAAATAISNMVEAQNRDMTEAEQSEFDRLVGKAGKLKFELDRHAAGATFAKPGSPMYLPGEAAGADGTPLFFPDATQFIKTGMGASLQEGSSLQYSFPATLPLNFVQAFGRVDPLVVAGATLHSEQEIPAGATTLKVNILGPGSDAATFSEGAGPSTSSDPTISTLSIDVAKVAMLLLPSEEAIQDINGLVDGLNAEALARVLYTVGKADVAALRASLISAGATTAVTGDSYTDMLALVDGVSLLYADPSNKFLMGRLAHKALYNVRDNNNRPLLDFSAGGPNGRIFGYDIVLSDALASKIIFGNFRVGCHVRRMAFQLLRLNEAYREQGQIGLRYWIRAGRGFYSDAVTGAGSEFPLLTTGDNWGS